MQDIETDDPSSSSTATTVILNTPDDVEGNAPGAETPEDLERQARRAERDRRKSQKKGKNGSKVALCDRANRKGCWRASRTPLRNPFFAQGKIEGEKEEPSRAKG